MRYANIADYGTLFVSEYYSPGYRHLSDGYDEINGYDFYRDIFPVIQNSYDENSDEWITNPIYYYTDAKSGRLTRRIMYKDTWEKDYEELIEGNPLCFCGGLTYRGKTNTLKNARQMNALIFDIDSVNENNYLNFFQYFTDNPDALQILRIPWPTYMVLSGGGCHLYYVFEEPIDLYPNIKIQMKKFKYELTNKLWRYEITSMSESPELQGINQGFRMVGSYNSKLGDQDQVKIRAFCIGNKVSLDYLNKFVSPESRVDVNTKWKPSTMSRAEAAEKYPEWYQRVVAGNKVKPKKWGKHKGHRGDELYNWWLKQLFNEELVGGHRYYYIVCLAAYAAKCNIPEERFLKDADFAFEHLKRIRHDHDFTRDDLEVAVKAYKKDYYNMRLSTIEAMSGLDFKDERKDPKNKRNHEQYSKYVKNRGSKALPRQKWHLDGARRLQERSYPEGTWREGNGRPSARQTVVNYRRENPDAKPKDCIVATGLSKNTVYKWWKGNGNETEL